MIALCFLTALIEFIHPVSKRVREQKNTHTPHHPILAQQIIHSSCYNAHIGTHMYNVSHIYIYIYPRPLSTGLAVLNCNAELHVTTTCNNMIGMNS